MRRVGSVLKGGKERDGAKGGKGRVESVPEERERGR